MTRIGVSLCAVVLVATACGRSGTYAASDDGIPGEPPGTPADAFTPDTGDGHDGPLAISGSRTFDHCVPMWAAEGTSASVTTTHPFVAGARVFLHQVQDAIPAGQDSPLTSTMGAGRWTIARVTEVAGGNLSLDREIERYESAPPAKFAQACLAPELTDFSVNGSISSRDWNGASGGVLVFFVKGTAELDGVNVSAGGFWGGEVGPSSSASPTADDVPLGDGGGKGEGLHGASYYLAGRGSLSTDGGGGNGRSAGGGGGGAGGAGGLGGMESDEMGATINVDAGGRGGRAIDVPLLQRAVFGGGGGAGQEDDDMAGGGGWGGGIVLVFAERFAGNLVVHADGQDGEDSGSSYASAGGPGGSGSGYGAQGDGAGGGGAGGSVLLWSRSVSTPTSVFVTARGGEGGWSQDGGGLHSGPGGGGGGGVVHLERIEGASIAVDGGAEGLSTTGNDSWGATEGSRGIDKLVK